MGFKEEADAELGPLPKQLSLSKSCYCLEIRNGWLSPHLTHRTHAFGSGKYRVSEVRSHLHHWIDRLLLNWWVPLPSPSALPPTYPKELKKRKRKERKTNPNPLGYLFSFQQAARKSQGIPPQSSVCTAEEEAAAAARCEVFPSAGGKADSSLASPHTDTKVGSGAVLLPMGVFAIPTAQAAKTLLGHQAGSQQKQGCASGRNKWTKISSPLVPHVLLSCCIAM